MALIFATSFATSVNAVTSGLVWQDGSKEITINEGDSLKFQVDVGSFSRPLTINLFLMNDEYEYIYEKDLVVNDYIFGDLYLVAKEHYKTAGDYTVYLEVTDGRQDFQIQTLDLHVLANQVINNYPVVTDIVVNENKGLFSFEVIASDADGDEIKDYESRVVSKGIEYSAFCEDNVCTFNSRDPTNDGFEFIESDDNAVVKARAYDGKNWGDWYEERFVIDNKEIVAEGEDHEPVLDLIGNREVFEDTELRFTVTTKDEDNDVFAVSADNLPSGASFKNSVFAWKPGYEVVGHGGLMNGILKFISLGMLGNEPSSDFEVTFTVIDSKGNYDLEKIKVKVKDLNMIPTLDAFNVNVKEGELAKVETFVSDQDNDKVKVTFSAPLDSNGEWQTEFTDSGIYVVTVTADDSYNGVVTKNININVADVNRAPVIDSIDGIREVFEGELIELTVNAHDDDNDSLLYSVGSNLFSKNRNVFSWQTNIGDEGTYSLINFAVEDGKGGRDIGSLSIVVKEKINIAPTAEIVKPERDLTVNTGDSVEFIGSGEDSDGFIAEYKWLINGEKVSGEDKFTYIFEKENTHKVEFLVKDNRDKWSEPDSVNIKVEKKIIILNSAPVIDSIDGIREVFAGDLIELTVNAHDDDNDELTYSITGNKFSQSGNRFTWRTSESDIGNHIFTAGVSDGELADSENVNVLVKEKSKVNQAPVVADIPNQEVFIGDLFTYQVVAEDEDRDVLTYSLTEKPSGMSIDSNGRISWRADKTGSYNIVIGVSDSKIIVSEEFTLLVKEKPKVNNAPNAVIDSPAEDVINIFKGSAINFRGHGEDVDNDRIVEYSWNFNGAATDSNNQNVFVVFDKVGSFTITFSVKDEKGAWDETPDTVVIIVSERLAVNQAPVVGDIPDQTITSGQAFNDINLDTFVIDLDNSDNEISWSVSNTNLIVSIDTNRIVKVSYPAGFTGSETIIFTARDPNGATDNDSAVFTVQSPPVAVNNNPVLTVKRAGSAVDKVTINEGENLILNLEGTDPDNDRLRFSAMNLPAGAVLTNNVFSWTPSNVQGGRNYAVAFRVFDLASNGRLKGGSDIKIVVITVNDSLEPMIKAEKEKVKRHILNVKNMIINNWETVNKEELFNFDVVVENKGNVRENNVKITLQIPQLDYYERSNSFDIKKNKAETRGFSVIVPEEISDEIVYAIVTVSSDKDEVTEVIGFLVEQ